MALILSIDLGTSNLKVGLVNENGEILFYVSSPTPKITNENEVEEQDPDALQSLILSLCKQVLEGEDRRKVKYIVSASYQFGLMLLDEERKPLTGMTLLTDTRSQQTFSEFLSFFEKEELYEKTGCPLISQYVLPRLFYFSGKEPELFKKAKYFSDSKSFLFEWLSGEWVTDRSTAAASQLYNLRSFQWDEGILSKMNLSINQFPEVEDGTQYVASVREEIRNALGLEENVKVVLGLYDGAALGMGLSGFERKVGIMNVGTSAMIRVPNSKPVFDKNKNKRIQAYAVQKDLFLNGGALNNAALPLNWMRGHLFDFDTQSPELLKVSTKPLVSLPYLTGERDSLVGPYASGVFFGIRESHTKIDFVRSVLEGVAFSMRYIYEAFEENNLEINEIKMGGGGSHIRAWPQIFADVLNIPITLSDEKEAALIGNVMLALSVEEKNFSLKAFYFSRKQKDRKVYPRAESVKKREQQYQFFRRLREGLEPFYRAYHLNDTKG